MSFNEITSLEYHLLKVPYENLNKKFRASQKVLEKNSYRIKEAAGPIEQEFKASNGPVPVNKVSDQIHSLVQRLDVLEDEFDKYTSEEIECAKALQERADYLKQGFTPDPAEVEYFRKQRLNRFIVDHLLRSGYFETAQKLGEHCGLEAFSNAQVFHIAKQVEESLNQGDLSICLAWISENRSKLHRLDSDFETEIRIQQCIELIKQERRQDAVTYSRKFFSGLPAHKWNNNLLQLMGLIGFGANPRVEVYQKLISQERYAYLVERFRQENARIFQLSTQSAFSACLQAGIAAHKTPNCSKDADSKCVVCRELFELGDGLPYAHASNSRLIDAVSGEPLNEQNQPFMLPNGRVYGENTIKKLAKEGKFECPRTNEAFKIGDIVRIFVL